MRPALAVRTLIALLTFTGARAGAQGFTPTGSYGEAMRTLHLDPGVTVTLVAPERLDPRKRVDLILYALPNGNTTAETMGRAPRDSSEWRYGIQQIAAQTRALRARGVPQAVVAYLEAEGKSWPAWRARLGYPAANARIVEIVDQVRAALGDPATFRDLRVTLTGHSGGGSFMFGFIEGQSALPPWLDRIAFLDANYNFGPQHGAPLLAWLRGGRDRWLVSIAYDDREIRLDGKKVVSDSGGTWRATERMLARFAGEIVLRQDTVGEFLRARGRGVELLRHRNAGNRILHTELVGEMNGLMHAMLVGRRGYRESGTLLRGGRAYARFVSAMVRE